MTVCHSVVCVHGNDRAGIAGISEIAQQKPTLLTGRHELCGGSGRVVDLHHSQLYKDGKSQEVATTLYKFLLISKRPQTLQ